MSRILITGATGLLGRELVQLATDDHHHVRALSRRPKLHPLTHEIEWRQGDLKTGAGMQAAVQDMQIVIHAATSPFLQTKKVDVEGTRRLLEYAAAAGVEHFIFPSIVGIEKIPFSYYQQKLTAEAIVRAGGVPWTILRATQFHALIDKFLQPARHLPIMLLPVDFKFQPLDGREMAARLMACVAEGPAGRISDMGGPVVHALGEMAKVWLQVRGVRRKVARLALPGGTANAFRRGENTTPEHAEGKMTWQQWLQQRYEKNSNSGE